ncbi:MAG: hypothetical protein WAL37_05945, partial [Xanthobacteraceae bacterium]
HTRPARNFDQQESRLVTRCILILASVSLSTLYACADFGMSPFRGRLSGKPLPTNTCVAVVPKAKRKHAWRISFTVEMMTDIALDHSPNCHIICGGILLVQFSAVNVSVG